MHIFETPCVFKLLKVLLTVPVVCPVCIVMSGIVKMNFFMQLSGDLVFKMFLKSLDIVAFFHAESLFIYKSKKSSFEYRLYSIIFYWRRDSLLSMFRYYGTILLLVPYTLGIQWFHVVKLLQHNRISLLSGQFSFLSCPDDFFP